MSTKRQEILDQIAVLQNKAAGLTSPVPLGPDNKGKRMTLDELREACEAQEKIDSLFEELRKDNQN